MLARAPASVANLGPGFDTLGLAVDRYVEVEVAPAPRLVVRAEGEGAGLAEDATHLAARVAIDVAGHDRLAITVRSEVPVARGLGSSAAVAVASAAAAGSKDPLGVAALVDGHPDNAAASMLGGLVAATIVRGAVKAVRMPFDPELMLVAIVPERSLPTTKARHALPAQVSISDAAFNLGRMGLLLAGLADLRVLSKEATEDRLHQDYRTPLFPEAPQLLAVLQEAGVLAACWSGAGPTVVGLSTTADAPKVAAAAGRALQRGALAGQVLVLRPDREGLVSGERARAPRARAASPPLVGQASTRAVRGAAVSGTAGHGVPGRRAPARPQSVFDFERDG